MTKLSPVKVKSLMGTPGLYADGNNLYLQVGDGGKASWIFRFQLHQKRRDMGRRGREFVQAHRGAVQRLADWIEATARPKR